MTYCHNEQRCELLSEDKLRKEHKEGCRQSGRSRPDYRWANVQQGMLSPHFFTDLSWKHRIGMCHMKYEI